jgi:hypothetical protein
MGVRDSVAGQETGEGQERMEAGRMKSGEGGQLLEL